MLNQKNLCIGQKIYPYLVSIKSAYVTYIASPSFLPSGGLLWTLRIKKRGKAAFGSMVSHIGIIAYLPFFDNNPFL